MSENKKEKSFVFEESKRKKSYKSEKQKKNQKMWLNERLENCDYIPQEVINKLKF